MSKPPDEARGRTAVKVTASAMLGVKAMVSGNIHVAYAIAVRHAECIFTFQIRRDFLQLSTCARIIASVHEGHMPGAQQRSDTTLSSRSRMSKLKIKTYAGAVCKVFLDQIPFVS